MRNLIEFALLGLGAGAVYTLLAQGVVLIYRASGVVNFAQGAMAMAGAYLFQELRDLGASYPVAMLVTVIAIGILGLAICQFILRPLRGASPLSRAIATLGVLAVIQAIGVLIYGSTDSLPPTSLPHNTVHIGSIAVPEDQFWLFAIAIAVTVALIVLSRYTRFGLATAAAAESETTVASLGWSPDLIAGASWFLASALAAVAGILIAPLTGLTVTIMVLMIVPALAAALVGGLTSFGLALAGGLLLGILQSEMQYYVTAPGWSQAIPFLVIIFILVVRGRGLPLRSHVAEKLPELGTGRIHPGAILVVGGGLLILLYTAFPISWVTDFSVSFVYIIFLLSAVVLTGYAGQLSLAQFALGGIGALFAARLVQLHVTFTIALILGVLGTAAVGVVLGTPALRTRGVNLAVVTLGLGSAIGAVVFNNSQYINGYAGTAVGPQRFLGVNVDYIAHPRNYAELCLILVIVTSLIVCNVRRGRVGRRLIAVRTNERAAASIGVSVFGSKLYAFSLAAGLAGLAGILYGFRGDTVTYGDFEPFHSISIVTLAVIGGIGYVVGASLGATLAMGGFGTIIATAIVGQNQGEWLALFGGVLLIVILLVDPDGLARGNVEIANRLLRKFRVAKPREEPTLPPSDTRAGVTPVSLRVRDLTVRFGGVMAIDKVSIDVRPGQVIGLIGPNGAGKTTFIDAISGFVRPAVGTIELGDNHHIEKWKAHKRVRAGITRSFQSLELFDEVTVLENIQAADDRRGGLAYVTDLFWPRSRQLSPMSVAAIREFGLEGDLAKRPGDLSYGRRRMVAIARSVATRPSILLLDEPAAGLTQSESAELGHLVRRLADESGIGIVLIEHDMSVVADICDEITVLNFGQVIASGPAAEVLANPVVVRAYLGEVEEPQVLAGGKPELVSVRNPD